MIEVAALLVARGRDLLGRGEGDQAGDEDKEDAQIGGSTALVAAEAGRGRL